MRDKLIGRNSNELRFGNTSNEEVERQWDLNAKFNKVFIYFNILYLFKKILLKIA